MIELDSTEAIAYAAEDDDEGCTSIMGTQMPSRKSAMILSSPFKVINGFDNLKPPDLRSWNADSIETARINDVTLTKVYWHREKCDEIRAKKSPFVFPNW